MTLKPITVRIPENLNDRLGYAAIDRRTTKQAIIIEALELWFEKKEEEEKVKEDEEMKTLVTAEERARLLSPAPVYRRYPGQWWAQSAYIVIDPERTAGQVYADYSGEIGNAVTARYYHGREAHIELSPAAYGPDILDFIADHAAEIRAVIDDYECEWDGSNRVGRWGETARGLLHRLERAARDEIRVIRVIDDPAELNLEAELTADTNPRELAAEIWAQIPAYPDPDYGWVPTFNLQDLEADIREMVRALKEDEDPA